jgi:plastocyanin
MWNSGILSAGQSFPFRFTTTGTFTYKCTLHPNMVGTITVQ